MSCTLYKIPPEMREAIILPTLPDEWTGETPEIIKAFRVDRKPHAEAMRAFHKMGYAYVLHRENDWGFGDMKRSAISTAKKVKIIIDCPRPGEPLTLPLRFSQLCPPDAKLLQESMEAATSSDEVDIEYNLCDHPGDHHRHGLYSSFLPYLFECGVASKCLKRFTFSHSYLSYLTPYLFNLRNPVYDGYWDISLISNCIEDANKGFGYPGKLTTVYAGTEDVVDEYMWVAEEGKFLAPKGWRNS